MHFEGHVYYIGLEWLAHNLIAVIKNQNPNKQLQGSNLRGERKQITSWLFCSRRCWRFEAVGNTLLLRGRRRPIGRLVALWERGHGRLEWSLMAGRGGGGYRTLALPYYRHCFGIRRSGQVSTGHAPCGTGSGQDVFVRWHLRVIT
jgi:hypothetical protein